MSIYVKFNDEGHSVEMTNVNPSSTDYVELGDDMMGKHLIKQGDSIREMTESEIEDVFKKAMIASQTIAVNNQAEHLLKNSDSLVLPDVWEAYTKEQKELVSAYRNALKNIDKQEGFPLEIVWPEAPNFKED